MQSALEPKIDNATPLRRDDVAERLVREVHKLRDLALHTEAGLAAALEALKANNEA